MTPTSQRNSVRCELRALVADRLVWWAWRLDPERFVKHGEFFAELRKLNITQHDEKL